MLYIYVAFLLVEVFWDLFYGFIENYLEFNVFIIFVGS